MFNNLFLTTAAATVLVGTLYPLVIEAVNGAKISVGEPFFNLTFGPLMIPLLLAVPIGPLLSWKRGDLMGALQRLYFAAGSALFVMILVLAFTTDASVLAVLGIGISVWVTLGAFAEIVTRSGFPKKSLSVAFKRVAGLPRSIWGSALGHAGMGLTLLGIVGVGAFQQEIITSVTPGQKIDVAGYSVQFDRVLPRKGSNYVEDVVLFNVTAPNGNTFQMQPSKRVYTTRRMPTTEAAIETFWFSQLYISPGDVARDGSVTVRFWWKPLVTLIWLGPLSMVFGGLISLSDRRLRIGAPTTAKARRKEVEAKASA